MSPGTASVRVGLGWDNHRIAQGRPLILGGIHIPCEFGLDGHSDADVLAHAITDALLGSVALGDIGSHFPDSDPRWKDCDSMLFLKHAAALVRQKGYYIGNVDSTVILQRPKLKESPGSDPRKPCEGPGPGGRRSEREV